MTTCSNLNLKQWPLIDKSLLVLHNSKNTAFSTFPTGLPIKAQARDSAGDGTSANNDGRTIGRVIGRVIGLLSYRVLHSPLWSRVRNATGLSERAAVALFFSHPVITRFLFFTRSFVQRQASATQQRLSGVWTPLYTNVSLYPSPSPLHIPFLGYAFSPG